jgi:hypothetical protein
MAELDKPEFKFPDENEEELDQDDKVLIEIESDIPTEDQGKESFPEEIKKELYDDELEDYSAKVKKKLMQMKKLAHDERREKEHVLREHQEAVSLAQKILAENNKLKSNLQEREKDVLMSIQKAVDLELNEAKRAYREAYESGETDRIVEAQERMTEAAMKVDKVKNYRPAPVVDYENTYTEPAAPRQEVPVDPTAVEWATRNSWFNDPKEYEMRNMALAVHQRLKDEGVVVSSKEYYRRIDETMRKRFPEKFESDMNTDLVDERVLRPTKSSTVVAPATRSTAPKKIRLSTTQVALAKKLGLTPEQYAQEVLKLES